MVFCFQFQERENNYGSISNMRSLVASAMPRFPFCPGMLGISFVAFGYCVNLSPISGNKKSRFVTISLP